MGRTVEGLACKRCGVPIVRVPRRGPLPVFCSKVCNVAGRHERESAERAKLRTGLTCAGCGLVFDAARWKRKWCSPECCQQHRRRTTAG